MPYSLEASRPSATHLRPVYDIEEFDARIDTSEGTPAWVQKLVDWAVELRRDGPDRDAEIISEARASMMLWSDGIDTVLIAYIDAFLHLERRVAASRVKLLSLESRAKTYPHALQALREADDSLVDWCETYRDARWDLMAFRAENKRGDAKTKTLTFEELMANIPSD